MYDSVVDMGDGTYAVRLNYGPTHGTYIRVNADLPVYSGGGLAFTQASPIDSSIDTAITEKAYFSFWGGYYNPGGGVPSDVFTILDGKYDQTSFNAGANVTSTLNTIA